MVTIIAAYSSITNAIGRKGTLPWPSLKGDFQFLKYITTRRPSGIIMGKNTFRAIGKPLTNRISIVLTSSPLEAAALHKAKLTEIEASAATHTGLEADTSKDGKTNSVLLPEPVEGPNYKVYYRKSLEEAVNLSNALGIEPVIFGGERVYTEAIKKYQLTLYLTEIYKEYSGDTFFPIHLVNRSRLINITEEVAGIIGKDIGSLQLISTNNSGKSPKRPVFSSDLVFSDNNIQYAFFKGVSNSLENNKAE